jgi:hypothetical protein
VHVDHVIAEIQFIIQCILQSCFSFLGIALKTSYGQYQQNSKKKASHNSLNQFDNSLHYEQVNLDKILICLPTNLNLLSAQDPCLNIIPVIPGTTYSFSLTSGEGMLNANCSGANEEGKEILFEYTASATGFHALDILSNNNSVMLAVMYKEASGGCNSTGWNCINGGFYGTPSYYITLTSGISYYIYVRQD